MLGHFFPTSRAVPGSASRSDCPSECSGGTETRAVGLLHSQHPPPASIAPAAHSSGADYFLTLIFFLTVLPPAFLEVTLKVSFTSPGFFAFSLTLIALVFFAAVLLEAEADALVYLPTPLGTHAIGQSYRDFPK